MHDNGRNRSAIKPVRTFVFAMLAAAAPIAAQAQQASITGRVTAEGNQPIADACAARRNDGRRNDESRRQIHPARRS